MNERKHLDLSRRPKQDHARVNTPCDVLRQADIELAEMQQALDERISLKL